jgi:hypothetical protein
MQVYIADTKNMWFGRNEKKIKELFTCLPQNMDKVFECRFLYKIEFEKLF